MTLHPRTRWLIGPLFFFGFMGCFDWLGLGNTDCNGPQAAGGRCQVGKSSCASSYYCALTETCTRACEKDSDCQVTCHPSTDNGNGCGVGDACDEDAGFCVSSIPMRCIEHFCQGNCPLPAAFDGGPCEYDLYGPSSFDGGS